MSHTNPGEIGWDVEPIVLYCPSPDMRGRLERLLIRRPFETAGSRQELLAKCDGGRALGVIGLESCSDADAAWLRDEVARIPGAPCCVVVALLSLSNLRTLQDLDRDHIRVLWEEEADERLASVLEEVVAAWRPDALRWLGQRIAGKPGLRPALRAVVEEICQMSTAVSPPPPPKRTVSELARQVNLSPATLSRYWTAEVPLRCGPNELLGWASLLWAVEHRTEVKWDAVAKRARVDRRTIDRRFARLAGCTSGQAARDPGMVRRRFREWVAEVLELNAE